MSIYTVLIDANNFFVSCERLFRPELRNKPVIVLSSNDGCVISRSEEAKALGLTMGEPYFKVRERCDQHGVSIFSSNFALYRDMSRRIMSVLRRYADTVEAYSVDEAFVALDGRDGDIAQQAHALHTAVIRETGIPVSVGVAHTKTLAKVATHFAKPKYGGRGVNLLLEPYVRNVALEELPVDEVWGIGFRLGPVLKDLGVTTAGKLIRMDDTWLRKRLSVRGLRTVYELRGTPCFTVGEDTTLRKSLLHSQSFGRPVYDLSGLKQAIAHHARKAAEVLRVEGAAAREVYVTIRTSRHTTHRYSAYDGDTLTHHTNDTITIVQTALSVLERMYRKGFPYAKAGVMVKDIVPEESVMPRTIFGEESGARKPLMHALDALRHRFGDRAVQLGAEELRCTTEKSWHPKSNTLSPRYTSSWADIPTVSPHVA